MHKVASLEALDCYQTITHEGYARQNRAIFSDCLLWCKGSRNGMKRNDSKKENEGVVPSADSPDACMMHDSFLLPMSQRQQQQQQQ